MTIPAAEREKMLRVALCGPRVIMRLERIGITCLDDLVERDPEELVLAVNLAAGGPIWRPPMATRAMTNLIEAARGKRATEDRHDAPAGAARQSPGTGCISAVPVRRARSRAQRGKLAECGAFVMPEEGLEPPTRGL